MTRYHDTDMHICAYKDMKVIDMLNTMTTWLKTLSDENRLRIVLLLDQSDYCVCELTEMLALPQPKVSKHLTKLKDLDLVESYRESRFVVYKLNRRNETLNMLISTIKSGLSSDATLLEDKARSCSCMASARRDAA